MTETFVFPQELGITYTNVASFPLPYIIGVPFFDFSTKILVVSTASRSSGTPVAGDFVTALPQHKTDGTHGPKVTITQTAADNALVVNQVGAATAVSLVCGSTNSGRALDISQAAAQNAVSITKSHTGGGHALNLNNSGTGHALNVDNSGSGSGLNLLSNSVGAAINIQQNGNAQGLFIQQLGAARGIDIVQSGNESGLRITQNSANNAIHVTGSFGNSSAAGIIFEKLAPANTDIQVKFKRSDGAGDPDMFLTYWGQSDVNTLALTNGSGNGVHVTANGRTIVGDFTVSHFTGGTAKFAVMDGYTGIGTTSPGARLQVTQTLADPAVVISQSADSNAMNITRSHTGSGGDAVNLTNSGLGSALDIMQANTAGSAALNIDHSASASAMVINKVSTNSANPVVKIRNSSSNASARDVEGHNANWWIDKSGNASFASVVASSSAQSIFSFTWSNDSNAKSTGALGFTPRFAMAIFAGRASNNTPDRTSISVGFATGTGSNAKGVGAFENQGASTSDWSTSIDDDAIGGLSFQDTGLVFSFAVDINVTAWGPSNVTVQPVSAIAGTMHLLVIG